MEEKKDTLSTKDCGITAKKIMLCVSLKRQRTSLTYDRDQFAGRNSVRRGSHEENREDRDFAELPDLCRFKNLPGCSKLADYATRNSPGVS